MANFITLQNVSSFKSNEKSSDYKHIICLFRYIFKKAFFMLLLSVFISNLTAQPSQTYNIEYNVSSNTPTKYILLIDKNNKKNKIKIYLPEPLYITQTPNFITDYIIQFKAVEYSFEYLDHSKSAFYFCKIDDNGNSEFILNKRYNTYRFSWGDKFCNFVSLSGEVYTYKGEYLPNYSSPTKFGENNKYCYITKLIGDNQYVKEFYNGSQKLKLQTPVSIDFISFSNSDLVIIFIKDTVFYYDIKADSLVAKNFSLPSSVITDFYQNSISFKNLIEETKLIPVRLAPDKWVYANEKAQIVIGPFDADLAMPFFLGNHLYAPFGFHQKWGVIDTKGNIIVPNIYDRLTIDKNYGNSVLQKGDSLFRIVDGKIQFFKTNTQILKEQQKPIEVRNNSTFVYVFENSYQQKAYILVYTTFSKLDNDYMSKWVLDAVAFEESILWKNDYRRVNNVWNNPYKADILYFNTDFYMLESQYKQKSSYVVVIRKHFE